MKNIKRSINSYLSEYIQTHEDLIKEKEELRKRREALEDRLDFHETKKGLIQLGGVVASPYLGAARNSAVSKVLGGAK